MDFIYFRGASKPTSRVYRALERFRRQGLERVFDAFPIFYKTVPNEGRRETKKSQSVSVGITQSGNVKNKPNHTARATEDSSFRCYIKAAPFATFTRRRRKNQSAKRNRCPTNTNWTNVARTSLPQGRTLSPARTPRINTGAFEPFECLHRKKGFYSSHPRRISGDRSMLRATSPKTRASLSCVGVSFSFVKKNINSF